MKKFFFDLYNRDHKINTDFRFVLFDNIRQAFIIMSDNNMLVDVIEVTAKLDVDINNDLITDDSSEYSLDCINAINSNPKVMDYKDVNRLTAEIYHQLLEFKDINGLTLEDLYNQNNLKSIVLLIEYHDDNPDTTPLVGMDSEDLLNDRLHMQYD